MQQSYCQKLLHKAAIGIMNYATNPKEGALADALREKDADSEDECAWPSDEEEEEFMLSEVQVSSPPPISRRLILPLHGV